MLPYEEMNAKPTVRVTSTSAGWNASSGERETRTEVQEFARLSQLIPHLEGLMIGMTLGTTKDFRVEKI